MDPARIMYKGFTGRHEAVCPGRQDGFLLRLLAMISTSAFWQCEEEVKEAK